MVNKQRGMMKKKFEYFLNAIHYCIYLEEVWTNKKTEKIVYGFLFFISKYFFPKRLKIKVYRRHLQSRQELNEYFYGKEFGQSIGVAHYLFGAFSSSYAGIFSFALLGMSYKMFGKSHNIINFVLIVIPLALWYIPIYKAVFLRDRYLQFFKQFEKEDKHWHRKWKRITIAFCIGAVFVTFLGICIMWGILVYDN